MFPGGVNAGYTWLTYGTYPQFLYSFGGTPDYEAVGIAKTYRHQLDSDSEWVELFEPWVAGSPPNARYFHSAVYRSFDNSWYVYGGTSNVFSGNNFADLWRFSLNLEVWEEIVVAGECKPSGRSLHAAAIMPDGTGMFVYGGIENAFEALSDLWMFHFVSKKWVKFETSGWDLRNQRDGHAMAIWLDKRTGVSWLYVFGGDEGQDTPIQYNDMHRLSLADYGCTFGSVASCTNVDWSCTATVSTGGRKQTILIVVGLIIFVAVLTGLVFGIKEYQLKKGAKIFLN
eukprot:TRINITY_DN32_c0_g1_i2.p1 TRINITY_DN32_c0_g1~~TRINITY_DN32_c0_g1_i2.p1  ORF type:complete len:285 (+),score=71.52 TRINITY_DN32_c0_g1_i2:553-1407(+)